MTGRVVVVTGATTGIGRLLAQRLAEHGATTVVVGRGDARATKIANEIARVSGNPRVEALGVSDLAVRAESHRVADELLRRYPAIHVLVNNAGGFFVRREVTSDGLERTFALNVLAPFILTSRLADRMGASAPARVVQIASAAHRAHHVDFRNLQGEHQYKGYRQYGRSKLELILLTREFGRRLAGRGVVVNAVHPGFVRSGFGLNNRGATAFGIRLASLLFGRSLVHGVDAPLFVATDPSVATITGAYFSGEHAVRGSAESNDMAMARRLYESCRALAEVPELPEPDSPATEPSDARPSGALPPQD